MYVPHTGYNRYIRVTRLHYIHLFIVSTPFKACGVLPGKVKFKKQINTVDLIANSVRLDVINYRFSIIYI